jgi:outer membrane protein TolC
LPLKVTRTGRHRLGLKLVCLALLGSVGGCCHDHYGCEYGLAERILPTADLTAGGAPDKGEADLGQPRPLNAAVPEGPRLPPPAPENGAQCGPAPALTLVQAIDTAFRQQPRLRVYLEKVEQARRAEDIAHAAFLPVAAAGYHVGGFDLNVGGEGIPLGSAGAALASAFTFIPFSGSVPVGLDINTGYEIAELKVQWLLCDFGRRLGRYNQAGINVDIAQLQADRARQTVANEVTLAYYQVLRARALGRTARDAVRRAADELGVARKLQKGGVVEREKVLRAQVQLAQSRRALDLTQESEAVAVAALNLAVGVNVSAPVQVADVPPEVPLFEKTLADCLQDAVAQRREFAVARRGIDSAQEGVRVASASFAPRLVAEGSLLDFQQAAPRGHADLALGLIKLEWVVFEGGKRVAEKHLADSRVRDALAEAESVADTIAFQVNRAYHQVVTARKGIARARPAVEQARENYRLVRARARVGDATPSEIVDAEAALTRAEEDYLNSFYDYLSALSRLEYAVGVTPTR